MLILYLRGGTKKSTKKNPDILFIIWLIIHFLELLHNCEKMKRINTVILYYLFFEISRSPPRFLLFKWA